MKIAELRHLNEAKVSSHKEIIYCQRFFAQQDYQATYVSVCLKINANEN
jgi:hypothetical protein